MLHNVRQPHSIRLHGHYLNILEKDDKLTVGIVILYSFRTRLNEAYISNVSFAKSVITLRPNWV